MNDSELRAYLLGRLPETEAARLEERLLEDEDLFATLRGVEDDLVDDFARGHLSDADARAFAGRTKAEAGRVLFAHALSKKTRKAAPHSGPIWIPFALAATVILGLGLPLFFSPVQAPVTAPAAKGATGPADVVLSVLIATTRSAGPGVEALLPKDTSLRLRIEIDPGDRFDRYRVELRSPSGDVAYRVDEMIAAAEAGTLTLNAEIPAVALGEGPHELAVEGIVSGGGAEALGFATIRVRRSR